MYSGAHACVSTCFKGLLRCLLAIPGMCGRLTGVGTGRASSPRRWSAGSVGCGRRRAPENNGSVWVELELEVDLP